jgi:hypothetical protein
MQAALMAQHDSRSPALIVTASAAFSFAADVVLVTILHQGLAGAAVATVVAQYLSFAALLWVCFQPGSLRPLWPAAARKLADHAAAAGRGGRKGILTFRATISKLPAAGLAAFHCGGTWPGDGGCATPSAPKNAGDFWESDGQSTQAASNLAGLVAAQKLMPAAGFSPPPSAAALSGSDSEANSASDSASDSESGFDNLKPDVNVLAAGATHPLSRARVDTGLVLDASAAETQIAAHARPKTSETHKHTATEAGAMLATHDKKYHHPHHDHDHQHDRGSATRRGALLAAVYAAKILCYFTIQGAAMRLAMVELAAHNAMFSLWNVCAYFPMPLQTTALTFVPRCDSDAVRSPDRRNIFATK